MINIRKQESILDNVVRGYREIEPAIMAALALRRHVYLEAKHGVGKTTLGKVLGRAVDTSGRSFRYYACDKAGIVDLGGIPDIDSGELKFSKSNRNIFGASVVVADELPRANNERMNYWLEILEERSFQGIPLDDLEIVIATGNPSTYSGNNKMDQALRSRFLFWLPCNNFDTVTADEIEAIVDLNLENRDIGKVAKDLSALITEMRKHIDDYRANETVVNQVKSFLGSFFQFTKDKIAADRDLRENMDEDSYISPREFGNLMAWSIFGLAGYFKALGYNNCLQHAGEYAVKYCINTRHAAAGEKFINICNTAWRQLRNMLMDGADTPKGILAWKFASAINVRQKVDFWEDNIAEVCDIMDAADIASMTGETLEQINKEDVSCVGNFWRLMKSNTKTDHVANEVEGLVITELHRKMCQGAASSSNTAEGIRVREVFNRYKNATSINNDSMTEILGV